MPPPPGLLATAVSKVAALQPDGLGDPRVRLAQSHRRSPRVRTLVRRSTHPPSHLNVTAGCAFPIAAAILGWAILHQTFTPIQTLGFALALTGSVLDHVARHPDRTSAATTPTHPHGRSVDGARKLNSFGA